MSRFTKGSTSGELNFNWKGNNVGYYALHKWVNNNFGKPTKCEHCGTTEKRLTWANVSQKYLRDRSDWLELCYSCHKIYDNKINNYISWNLGKSAPWAKNLPQTFKKGMIPTNAHLIEYMGIKDTVTNWAKYFSLNYKTLAQRIYRRGWEFGKAIHTPIGNRGGFRTGKFAIRGS